MSPKNRSRARLVLLFAALPLAPLAGCETKTSSPAPTTGPSASGRMEDAWGFSFVMPAGWSEGNKRIFTVPGELRYALVPPGSAATPPASITVFLQKPNRAFTARQLLDMSVTGMKKSGGEIAVQEVRTVAGNVAMWLDVVGPGTGAAFVPGGTVRTAQTWVAIPRGNDVLVLLYTAPEASTATYRKTFDDLVGSLAVTGAQTAEQKASK